MRQEALLKNGYGIEKLNGFTSLVIEVNNKKIEYR